MLANTERDFIMLKGTPNQVAEAIQIIEELDSKSAPVSDGPRTVRRVISMNAAERDRILESFEDVWPTMGRDNPFDVRKPQSKAEDGSLFRRNEKRKSLEEMLKEQGSVLRGRLFEVAACMNPSMAMRLSDTVLQAPGRAIPGDPFPGDHEPSPGDEVIQDADGYKLPPQIKSVPGAPVKIWGTEYGIIIESQDLDAGDDAEYLVCLLYTSPSPRD